MLRIESLRWLRTAMLAFATVSIWMLVPAGSSTAQKVDGIPGKAATAPVNLQLTPTDAFVRIRGWSLPAPACHF